MASQQYRRLAAGLMLLAVCLVIVPSIMSVTGPTVLSIFSEQPADPILTPAFMGYDGGEGAVRELARIAGPLQGAFSPVSRDQLYGGYRGLGGTDQPAYEIVPLEEGNENPISLAPRVSPRSDEPLISPQELRMLRSALKASALSTPVSSFPRAQALRAQKAKDGIEKLYAQLRDAQTQREAQPFLQEDQQVRALEAAIGGQASLHRLEPRLSSEAKSSEAKLHDDADKLKEAKDDLRLYQKHVRLAEQLGANNVKYLKASQNYAEEATKEMQDATRRDAASTQVLKSADAILRQAHTAEVQARVNDDAAELTRAAHTISGEIARVRAAKANDEVAARERADAKENAFVSTVIGKVREQRFDDSKLRVRAMAEEGRGAEQAERQDTEAMKQDAAREEKAAALLSRARYQDEAQAAVTAGKEDAAGGLTALGELE
eukprot:CAMPEP_0196733236 /NCGR_PEP_ID=MMETSP1091-20130531/12385_1 /TAXON_ID=302021 /ORGANISM="Rhodomonas sp., Strain CCMP768" /LENGTH=433 /DNA_ID=CAMNT_0042076597 /DNA_START=13 /DNA_END=1311 /DNA_ORIENTATION=-